MDDMWHIVVMMYTVTFLSSVMSASSATHRVRSSLFTTQPRLNSNIQKSSYRGVASAFSCCTSRSTHRHHKLMCRRHPIHSQLQTVHSQRRRSFVLFASQQYQVGDEVLIDSNSVISDASMLCGIVEEARGGGWYTIRLNGGAAGDDGDDVRVKRRGTQLQKRSVSTIAKSGNALGEGGGTGSLISADKAPVEIIDLDSLLQRTHQSNKTSNQNITISTETINQITSCHSKYKRWLIFSDLHVMPSTLTTCIQVLNYVHTTALQYDAGILFLGDFWHHRGFVRVDCLNAVLAELSKWTVPCIMLPGNHDQISWSGMEHALTPLGNAYRIPPKGEDGGGETKQLLHPGPLIFSHPTKFKDALFVPHIRDKSTMKAVLSSKEAINSSALFVHADVKGASMNDLIKSQHGLSASFFPSDRYVYSGHFHKPHFVQLSKKSESLVSIRYVGSPYQTSLSEAGQSKSLILVDSEQNWKCVEEIPIDIGRRYHRITDMSRFLDLKATGDLRSGDKVAVIVPQHELHEARVRAEQDSSVSKDGARGNSSFDIRVDELRSAGIAVDIRDVQMRPNEGGDGASLSEQATGANAEDAVALEELSPFATLKAYLNSEVASGAMGEETRKKLLTEGELMLKELSEDALQNGGLAPIVNTATMTHIELDSVVIAGFGSFRKKVKYPLSKRGVVLLRGTNKDFGSDR